MELLISLSAVLYALVVFCCLSFSVIGLIRNHFSYAVQCEAHKQETYDRECRLHNESLRAKYFSIVKPALIKGAK